MGTLAALILCGGESRRMGQPKAWLPFGGECLLQRVARRLAVVADPIVVVAAPDQELPELRPGVCVVRDPIAHRGPLQGLATGLAALEQDAPELVYATATDTPFLEPAWPQKLTELIGDDDLAIPHVDGFHHPLAALYRREPALIAVRSLLATERYRPVFLLEQLRTRVVSADELRVIDRSLATLRNLNTPEEYQSALREAGISSHDEMNL